MKTETTKSHFQAPLHGIVIKGILIVFFIHSLYDFFYFDEIKLGEVIYAPI